MEEAKRGRELGEEKEDTGGGECRQRMRARQEGDRGEAVGESEGECDMRVQYSTGQYSARH